MTGDEFLKGLACLVAWRDERSNQINGMTGVLFVLRNRVQAGPTKGFGQDWGEVIGQHYKFSGIFSVDDKPDEYPDVRDATFSRMLALVDDVYTGEMVDNLTDSAYYYADLSNPQYRVGGWFDRNIARQPDLHPRCAQIGSTTYFR